MKNEKNEAVGLLTEILYAAFYCGVFIALVFLIVR
ncbi:hypothetical protein SDC9_160916 [bioreactor metagenome]|uniref:Uncharacterized protein n=1 Tax=bioreactor metagenome TaxID=1076179 RepID=A0A645FMF5_9ZZZZ